MSNSISSLIRLEHCDHASMLMQTLSSSAAVFGTHELLVKIITYLPPRQILRARRVGPTWKAAVDTSPTMPEALFLEAAQPLFAIRIEHIKCWHGDIVGANIMSTIPIKDLAPYTKTAPPFRESTFSRLGQRAFKGERLQLRPELVKMLGASEYPLPASMLDMFVAQPPVGRISVMRKLFDITVSEESGVRHQHYLDAICASKKTKPRAALVRELWTGGDRFTIKLKGLRFGATALNGAVVITTSEDRELLEKKPEEAGDQGDQKLAYPNLAPLWQLVEDRA